MLVNNNLPLQKKVDNLPTENSDNLVSSGGVFNAIDYRGIPSGGMNGQVLSKASDDDYDTTWLTPDETDGVDLTNYVTNEKLDEKLENLNIDTSNLTTKTEFDTYKTEVNGMLGDISAVLSEILNGGNEGLLDLSISPISSAKVSYQNKSDPFGGVLDASV